MLPTCVLLIQKQRCSRQEGEENGQSHPKFHRYKMGSEVAKKNGVICGTSGKTHMGNWRYGALTNGVMGPLQMELWGP